MGVITLKGGQISQSYKAKPSFWSTESSNFMETDLGSEPGRGTARPSRPPSPLNSRFNQLELLTDFASE